MLGLASLGSRHKVGSDVWPNEEALIVDWFIEIE
jgi:hypothetical protein